MRRWLVGLIARPEVDSWEFADLEARNQPEEVHRTVSDPAQRPPLHNPIETQIEDGFAALKAANKAYKSAIGDRQSASADTAAARKALSNAEGAETATRQTEDQAKGAQVEAIDGLIGHLQSARNLLVPGGAE